MTSRRVEVQVLPLSTGRPLALVAGGGTAHAVVGTHMGALHRTMCLLVLEPGGATVDLRHASEAVWYVVEGSGVAVWAEDPLELETGAMVHIGAGASYGLRAAEDTGLRLVGGPSPPDPLDFGEVPPTREKTAEAEVRLFHRDRPSRHMPMISSDARLVVWPGVGAHTANMNYVWLAAGEANQAHRHPESEDTIVILSGRGTVDDLDNGVALPFEAGDVIHVPIGVEHRVKADRGQGVESVGGPCPPDTAALALSVEL